MNGPKGLGKGLSTLLGEASDLSQNASGDSQAPRKPESTLPIEHVRAGPFQPRRIFDEAALDELAQSIKQHGIIQPLIVRKRDTDQYEIIAGERRWRAAQKAGLHELPVIIRDLTQQQCFEIAILENVQREDLSPLEEARAYRQLLSDFGYRQEDLANAVGKSRVYIANSIRLLNLPDTVLDMLANGQLTAGHGRALLAAEYPEVLAQRVIDDALSVRETERLVKTQPDASGQPAAQKAEKSADTKALESQISAQLGFKVEIKEKKAGRGTLMLEYKSLDQFDQILKRLGIDPSG